MGYRFRVRAWDTSKVGLGLKELEFTSGPSV